MPSSAAIWCLALNIYYESNLEPLEGKYAVAHVTMNRAKEQNLSVCKIVFQKNQFSWTIKALDVHKHLKKEFNPPHNRSWSTAKHIATDVIKGTGVPDFTNGANYYFADYMKIEPIWARCTKHTNKYGHHYFFRNPQ